MPKAIYIQYFAVLRDQRGVGEEMRQTDASTPGELYDELRAHFPLSLPRERIKVAINGEFASWEADLRDTDRLVFLPPVAGG